MGKAVTAARQPDATQPGADAIYRRLFDSFNPDSGGRISPPEVLSRLERSGLRADDPRFAEALTGLADADGSRRLSFAQFKALARHTMHPTISYHLAQARIAGLRHHAQRAVLARAARRARRGPRGRAAPLLPTLRRLARRGPSPGTARQVPVAGPGEAASVLTHRELDELRLVAQGLTNPGIARQLVLSEHTVHRHLANIFRKLNLSSRAAAAAWGVRAGLM